MLPTCFSDFNYTKHQNGNKKSERNSHFTAKIFKKEVKTKKNLANQLNRMKHK